MDETLIESTFALAKEAGFVGSKADFLEYTAANTQNTEDAIGLTDYDGSVEEFQAAMGITPGKAQASTPGVVVGKDKSTPPNTDSNSEDGSSVSGGLNEWKDSYSTHTYDPAGIPSKITEETDSPTGMVMPDYTARQDATYTAPEYIGQPLKTSSDGTPELWEAPVFWATETEGGIELATPALLELPEHAAMEVIAKKYPTLNMSPTPWNPMDIVRFEQGQGVQGISVGFDNFPGGLKKNLDILNKVIREDPVINGSAKFSATPPPEGSFNFTEEEGPEFEANINKIKSILKDGVDKSHYMDGLHDIVLEGYGIPKWDYDPLSLSGGTLTKGAVIEILAQRLFDDNESLYSPDAEKLAAQFVNGEMSLEDIQKNFYVSDAQMKAVTGFVNQQKKERILDNMGGPAEQSKVMAIISGQESEYHKRMADGAAYFAVTGKPLRREIKYKGVTYTPLVTYGTDELDKGGVITPYNLPDYAEDAAKINVDRENIQTSIRAHNEKMVGWSNLEKEIISLTKTSTPTDEERETVRVKLEKYDEMTASLRLSVEDINKKQAASEKDVEVYLSNLEAQDNMQSLVSALQKNYAWDAWLTHGLVSKVINPIKYSLGKLDHEIGGLISGGYVHESVVSMARKQNEKAALYKPLPISVETSADWVAQSVMDGVGSVISLAPLLLTRGKSKGLATLGTRLTQTSFFMQAAGGDSIKNRIRRAEAQERTAILKESLISEKDPDIIRSIVGEIEDLARVAGFTDMEISTGSAFKGANELLFEGFGSLRTVKGLGNFVRLAKRTKQIPLFKGGVKTYGKIGGLIAKGLGVELLEESGTEMSNNLVDMFVYGDDVSIMSGLDKDFFANVLVTSFLIMGPSISKSVYALATNEIKSRRGMAEQLAHLDVLNEIDVELQNPDLTADQIHALAKKRRAVLANADMVEKADWGHFIKLEDAARREWIKTAEKINGKRYEMMYLGEDHAEAELNKEHELAAHIAAKLKKLKSELTGLLETGESIIATSSKADARKTTPESKDTEGDNYFNQGITNYNTAVAAAMAANDGKLFFAVRADTTLEELTEEYGEETAVEVLKARTAGSNGTATADGKHFVVFPDNQAGAIRILTEKMKKQTGDELMESRLELSRVTKGGIHELMHGYNVKRILDNEGLGLAEKPLDALKELIKQLRNTPGTEVQLAAIEAIESRYAARGLSEAEVAEEVIIAVAELVLGGHLGAGQIREMYHFDSMLYSMMDDAYLALSRLMNGPDAAGTGREFAHIVTEKDIMDYIEGFRRALVKGRAKINSSPEEKTPAEKKAARSKLSMNLSEEMQTLYDERGVEAAWEIASLNKGLAIKHASKYRNVPEYSDPVMYQIFIDEILTSKRGVIGLVNSYNPDLGIPLSAYINSLFENRVKGIAGQLFGEQFTKKLDEIKEIAAEEVAEVDVAKDQAAPKVSSIIRRKLRLDEKQMNVVRRAAIRALVTAPKIKAEVKGKPKAFHDHLSKTFNTLLFKMIKDHMGTGSDYRMWAKQNFEIFDKHMSIAALVNGQMDLFYKPVIGNNGKQVRMTVTEANDAGIPMDKAGAGPAKWERTHPSIEAFYSWVMAEGMAPTTKGARKTTMARLMAREVGFDATMETLSNTAQQEYNEDGSLVEGKTVNVLERVFEANDGEIAPTAVIGMVAAIFNKHPKQKFSTNPDGLFSGTSKAAIEFRKGKRYHGIDTGSGALNTGIRNLVSWLELNNWWHVDDKTFERLLAEAKGFRELFDAAVKTYENKNSSLQKARLKTPAAIKRFVLSQVDQGSHARSVSRIFGADRIKTEKELVDLISATYALLTANDVSAKGVEAKGTAMSWATAAKLIIRSYQPSTHKGERGLTRGNQMFYDNVVVPFINGITNQEEKAYLTSMIRLQEVKLPQNLAVSKKKETPQKYYTFVWGGQDGGKGNVGAVSGEKITPIGSLDQGDQTMNALIKGKLTADQLSAFDQQAQEVRDDIISLIDKVKGKLTDTQMATMMTLWGDQTRAMGKWIYKLGGIYTTPKGINETFTVEHQPPYSQQASHLGLYAIGVITKSELMAELDKAVIILHSQTAAKALNKVARDTDIHEGKVGKNGPERTASFNVGNTYVRAEAVAKQSEVTIARALRKGKLSLNEEFNGILEDSSNMPANLIVAPSQAIKRGKKAARYLKNQGIMVSAAEDFVGLLYKMISAGKTGEAHLEWLLERLVLPYDQAVDNVSRARIRKREQFATIPKSTATKKLLKGEAFDGFNGEDAVRMYIWRLRKADGGKHVKSAYYDKAMIHMEANPELKAYADAVHAVAGAVAYAPPGKRWAYGSIALDLIGGINGDLRTKELEVWQANIKEIFSEDNLNKLEALYGQNYRQALENILERMRTGRNRNISDNDRTSKWFQGWVSNQVGVIMLLNMRSSVLQLLSTFNYINTSDNNPIKAILRLLNTPQYLRDMRHIMKSPFLKDRTAGMRMDVNEEDIVLAEREATNIITKALKVLLNKGFMPTRLMDAAAITVGGAGFYRNRANTYVSEGMTIEAAEKLAFEDFRRATISSQQSSDPRMVSQQQASTLGRLILQFGNTPGQYMRIQLKAMKDIINGRGNVKKHVATIAYYGILQNAVFTMLQQALWAAWFDDEDEWAWTEEGRTVTDGMISSMLRGVGVYGAAIDTLIRVLRVKAKEDKKEWMGSNEKVVLQFLSISPGVGSMARKVSNSLNVKKYRSKEYGLDPWSLHSPEVEEAAWMLEGTMNIPAKRVLDKMHNLESIMSGQNEAWQNISLFWGWKPWQLGVDEIEMKVKPLVKTKDKPVPLRTRKELLEGKSNVNKEVKKAPKTKKTASPVRSHAELLKSSGNKSTLRTREELLNK